jgi:inorganic pyrophosphatase
VEIPAGSNQKWEVKKNGKLVWDQKNGKNRYINYLAYPGNYGMIPQTLSGDGDPFDILVLGPGKKRGAVIKAKVIGVLKTLDDGEEDDKLIAVYDSSELDKIESETTNLYNVSNLKQMRSEFPGVLEIISLFFLNYKGKSGNMKTLGFSELKDYPKWEKFILKN